MSEVALYSCPGEGEEGDGLDVGGVREEVDRRDLLRPVPRLHTVEVLIANLLGQIRSTLR